MFLFVSGAKLGFTDTDSFMYQLPCPTNIYEKFKELDPEEKWMDFSNYPPNHPNFSKTNHLVPGKFKDEGAGSPFSDGVFLRSKMYSIRNIRDTLNKTTAKGISRSVKEKKLKHMSYLQALESPNTCERLSIPKISCESHRMYTVTIKKRGLSAYNDKIHMKKQANGKWETHSFGYIE